MSALTDAVEGLEAQLRRTLANATREEQLHVTLCLLALRRAAGMPARLCGPAGRWTLEVRHTTKPVPLRLVTDDGPSAA